MINEVLDEPPEDIKVRLPTIMVSTVEGLKMVTHSISFKIMG